MEIAGRFAVHSYRSTLLGPGFLPVFQWSEGAVGRSFFWEQRFWLEAMKIMDKPEYRKREKRQAYLENLSRDWGLASCDFVRRGDGDGSIKTTIMSSPMLIAWLFMKMRHFEKARGPDRSQPCIVALHAIFRAARTNRLDIAMLPRFTFLGVVLQLSPACTLDLRDIVARYPGLPGEWQAIRASGLHAGLPPFPMDHIVAIGELLAFVEARVHYSPELDISHWVRLLRTALLQGLAFVFELAVAAGIES